MDEIDICFTEQEAAQILWVLSEASDLATAADALSSLAMIEGPCAWSAIGLTAGARSSRVPFGAMVERVKVTEAVRRTGVPGTVIFLAIRHGELTSEQDDRGYDWVDPDEVASLTVPR